MECMSCSVCPKVRQISTVEGLSHFKLTESWQQSEWGTWPHLLLALDQGPDGVAASQWMLYKESMNVTFVWD
eukprot:6037556-Amphidinium_carterae.2